MKKIKILFLLLLAGGGLSYASVQKTLFSADVVASACHVVVDADGTGSSRLTFGTYRKSSAAPVPPRDFTVRLYETGATVQGCSAFLAGQIATLNFGNPGQLDGQGVVTRGAGDGMGYAVVRPEMSPPGAYDLALVALSAEPLTGWGRHLQDIRMLHAASPVPMVVLVPSRLQEMRLLRGTAQVISGRDSLLRLRDMLRQALERRAGPESSGELTELRKRTLISLCTAINRNASLKAASRKDYYLRACLVEYAGVENLHVLCTSGLLPGVITDETGQRF
ncbi:hypothetical protein H6Y77_003402 [Salmonella enterica subsp. enterica serovar Reading]|nr:hypothetical protein [Salmonella enterica subsp. enterica serovar Reading]